MAALGFYFRAGRWGSRFFSHFPRFVSRLAQFPRVFAVFCVFSRIFRVFCVFRAVFHDFGAVFFIQRFGLNSSSAVNL